MFAARLVKGSAGKYRIEHDGYVLTVLFAFLLCRHVSHEVMSTQHTSVHEMNTEMFR